MTTKITVSLRAAIVGLALAFLVLPAAPLGGMVPIPAVGSHAFADETCAGSHIRGSSFGNCGGGGTSDDDDDNDDDDGDDPGYGPEPPPSCASGEVWDSVSGRCEPTHCVSGRSRDLSCFPEIEDDFDENIRPTICRLAVGFAAGFIGTLACAPVTGTAAPFCGGAAGSRQQCGPLVGKLERYKKVKRNRKDALVAIAGALAFTGMCVFFGGSTITAIAGGVTFGVGSYIVSRRRATT